ncbi:MAG: outer membrane beta-barrel protein [Cetobacterium sp.]|uniref:outer membrane beta-barrel protein n=1 Tax=Cetobacterium sp. TaxID=2071632 RepID=UPI003F2FEEDE
MKKIPLILGTLLLVGATSYAKEVAVASVESSKEVVVVPVIVEVVPVVVAYTPLYNIYGKVGLDVWSEYDEWKSNDDYGNTKFNKKDTKDLGFEIALEGTRNITNNFELGLGVAYQNHAKPKSRTITDFDGNWSSTNETEMPKFDSVPLYAIAKYNFETGTAWKPYLKATLGYSFNIKDKDAKDFYSYTSSYEQDIYEESGSSKFKTDIENGLYYGVGAGVEYENFYVDLMYQVNEAKAKLKEEYDGESYDFGKKDFDYSRVTLGFGYKFSF